MFQHYYHLPNSFYFQTHLISKVTYLTVGCGFMCSWSQFLLYQTIVLWNGIKSIGLNISFKPISLKCYIQIIFYFVYFLCKERFTYVKPVLFNMCYILLNMSEQIIALRKLCVDKDIYRWKENGPWETTNLVQEMSCGSEQDSFCCNFGGLKFWNNSK